MIKCQNISKIYKNGENEFAALEGVSFEIGDGELVAIIGHSGSGKSTLMHILGALDRPSNGNYFLDNRNIFEMSDDELAKIRSQKIGFVFQSFNLLPRADVFRNVLLPLIYDQNTAKINRFEKVEKSLMAVGLEKERWNYLANNLSGGQKQRVAIARALVNNPDIILADEPTGNLDSKTRETVLNTFRKLNRETGHTIILITHEKYVAEHADRVIEIKDGRIIADFKNKAFSKDSILK
jgi:putative ABC transport system ATP-binding protein